MTLAAILLLTFGAFTHAAWNLVSKREEPDTPFFLVTNTVATLCLLPTAILFRHELWSFSRYIWMLLFATGFFQALYYAALGKAYRGGDMSVAYPLARSMPVVMVALANEVLGRGKEVSHQSLCGMALIVLGVVLLPISSFREFKLKNYQTPMCLLALVAAIGTTGYMIIDDQALRTLRAARHVEGRSYLSLQLTMLFAFFEGVSASAWLGAYVGLRPQRLRSLPGVIATKLKPAVVAGIGICVSYTIVLVAMGLVQNVSYVVAFRQSSILVGGMFGIMVLKEAAHGPKLLGLLCALAGLVLVATG